MGDLTMVWNSASTCDCDQTTPFQKYKKLIECNQGYNFDELGAPTGSLLTKTHDVATNIVVMWGWLEIV